MPLVGAGVGRGPGGDDLADLPAVGVVDRPVAERQVGHRAVVVDRALAGRRQHQELVGVVAADRPGVGAHRDRLQPHALVGADVADHVAVVGVQRVLFGQVEVVAVLHQELAPAHHPEARPHLVAELPLDVVERQRQVLVARHRRAEDVGDQLLVGRPVEHVALVAVLDAQHLGAVVVVAPALAPEVGRLQRRHQQRDVPGALLLLVDDLLDPAQHLVAERQPRIDAGARLPDHAGAQHQPVAGDLRLGRRLAQDRQEVLGQAHVARASTRRGSRRFRRSARSGAIPADEPCAERNFRIASSA